MSIALFLVFFGIFALFLYHFGQNKKLKYEYSKLQEELQRVRNEQETFSIEIEKSNQDLASKPSDALTGLPERAAFEDRLHAAVEHGKRYSVIFALISIDMDDFSRIDQGSPRTRDELLVQISERILSVIRGTDSLTRYTGSQFVLLLPHIAQPESAAYAAARIQEAILQPFMVDTEMFHFTAGIGIALYPLDGDNVEMLLQKSSSALSEAKRSGKNKCHFWHREIHSMSVRESQLFIALRAPDLFTTLTITYTPQVLLSDNRMTGIYAEPMMLHPELGEIKSKELIKLAEHCGLATEIMTWLFRESIQKATAYHALGDAPLKIALPVKARQVENAHFVFQMAQIAGTVDPHILQPVFELTDTPTRKLSSLFRQGISTLSAAHVCFAIYLTDKGQHLTEKFPEIPIQYMKTDMKMLESLIDNPEGTDILSSLLKLTQNAGIAMIIEGVDDTRQKEFLQQKGFQTLQGKQFEYLLGNMQTEAPSPS